VVVLAHCLLNANTRLQGIAKWPGARADVLGPYIEQGVGIIQLPCPEASLFGMRRWAATREQYDTTAFRRHCRALASDVVDTIETLAHDGCDIEAVVGVQGSPSCGVLETSEGFSGGPIDEEQTSERVAGTGIFMQELRSMLAERNLDVRFSEAGTETS
jgi:predicted secreted protein